MTVRFIGLSTSKTSITLGILKRLKEKSREIGKIKNKKGAKKMIDNTQEKITVTSNIAVYISTTRKMKEITGYQLSKMVNKGDNFIANVENNRLKNIQLEDMIKIVSILSEISDRTKILKEINKMQDVNIVENYEEILTQNVYLRDENRVLKNQLEQIRRILSKPTIY